MGYVVAAAAKDCPPAGLEVSQLRAQLRGKLPDYMVPSAIVVLDALPLTPSGKVDRKSLPAPDPQSDLQREYVPPRSRDEEDLCSIWQRVLNVPRVGVLDNFFELGGHSLLATQTIARVAAVFGVELPVRLLFEEGTVAAMGRALKQFPRAASPEATALVKDRIDEMDAERIRGLLEQKTAEKTARHTGQTGTEPD